METATEKPKTELKIVLVWQDIGYCVNYYKIINEGKNKNKIICAIDIIEREQNPSNWHSCGNEVEGEPAFPINMNAFSIKVYNELKEWARNPRIIAGKKFDDLITSMDKFGYVDQIVINTDGELIGGHARLMKLKQDGHPTIFRLRK